jgi:hypothetical protein
MYYLFRGGAEANMRNIQIHQQFEHIFQQISAIFLYIITSFLSTEAIPPCPVNVNLVKTLFIIFFNHHHTQEIGDCFFYCTFVTPNSAQM